MRSICGEIHVPEGTPYMRYFIAESCNSSSIAQLAAWPDGADH